MKLRILVAVTSAFIAFTVPASAMAKKERISVRFHAEANPRDTGTFAMPVSLQYAQREAVLNRVPEISERMIDSIFPFRASDGTWGCAFQLDPQGRIRLETMSNQQRGSALVLFVGTKNGKHQVVDMVIDRPMPSGLITVPRGLTELEIEFLKKDFPVIGAAKPKKKSWFIRDKEDAIQGGINRDRDARENAGRTSAGRPAAAEVDLPRFRD